MTTGTADIAAAVPSAGRMRKGLPALLLLYAVCSMLLTGCRVTTPRARHQLWVDWRRFNEPKFYWQRDTISKSQSRRNPWIAWDKRQFVDPRFAAGPTSANALPAATRPDLDRPLLEPADTPPSPARDFDESPAPSHELYLPLPQAPPGPEDPASDAEDEAFDPDATDPAARDELPTQPVENRGPVAQQPFLNAL